MDTTYFSDFSIDSTGTNQCGISLNHIPSGTKQNLSAKEHGVLIELVKGNGAMVDRNIILNKVWDDNGYFEGRCMDVVICKLRRYLRLDVKIRITNTHGRGYTLQIEQNV